MIACIGNIVADILIKPFEDIPASGVLRAVDRIQLGLGGCAGNAAAILGRMGAEVSLLCGIGGDGLARFLLDELRQAGVGLQGVRAFPDAVSSASIVCIDRSGDHFSRSLARRSDTEWGMWIGRSSRARDICTTADSSPSRGCWATRPRLSSGGRRGWGRRRRSIRRSIIRGDGSRYSNPFSLTSIIS